MREHVGCDGIKHIKKEIEVGNSPRSIKRKRTEEKMMKHKRKVNLRENKIHEKKKWRGNTMLKKSLHK